MKIKFQKRRPGYETYEVQFENEQEKKLTDDEIVDKIGYYFGAFVTRHADGATVEVWLD